MNNQANKTLLVVRTLRAEDAEKFCTLRLKALEENPIAYGIAVRDEAVFTREEWKKICEKAETQQGIWYVIAEYEGAFIGMLGARSIFGSYMQHQVEIISAFVEARFRGQGIMKRLFILLKEELQKKTYLEQMIVWVTLYEGQRGKLVFEKLGFTFAGILSRSVKIEGHYYDCCWLEAKLYG